LQNNNIIVNESLEINILFGSESNEEWDCLPF
jgi:hypothetical protein